jgi:hypothetical protein
MRTAAVLLALAIKRTVLVRFPLLVMLWVLVLTIQLLVLWVVMQLPWYRRQTLPSRYRAVFVSWQSF